jgi:hypothetical protein
MKYESALVVLVPEAEPLVSPFRQEFDPAAAQGVPAHITINYPFQAISDKNRQQIYASLEALFKGVHAFGYSLAETRRFPGVLYLAPEPEQPFEELIHAVADCFPESPPYEGVYDEVIPHLTVADVEEEAVLDRVRFDFTAFSRGRLPVHSMANAVCLLDNREGLWKQRKAFPLRV